MSEAVSKVTFKCQPELVEGDFEAEKGFDKLNLTAYCTFETASPEKTIWALAPNQKTFCSGVMTAVR